MKIFLEIVGWKGLAFYTQLCWWSWIDKVTVSPQFPERQIIIFMGMEVGLGRHTSQWYNPLFEGVSIWSLSHLIRGIGSFFNVSVFFFGVGGGRVNTFPARSAKGLLLASQRKLATQYTGGLVHGSFSLTVNFITLQVWCEWRTCGPAVARGHVF